MRRKVILFGAVSMVAGSMFLAGPAHADTTYCVGSEATFALCTDPAGAKLVEDCVYLGDETCTPVAVYGPRTWCVGAMARAICDPGH